MKSHVHSWFEPISIESSKMPLRRPARIALSSWGCSTLASKYDVSARAPRTLR